MSGSCGTHPYIRCYNFKAPNADWHFELTEARLKAWANGIVSLNVSQCNSISFLPMKIRSARHAITRGPQSVPHCFHPKTALTFMAERTVAQPPKHRPPLQDSNLAIKCNLIKTCTQAMHHHRRHIHHIIRSLHLLTMDIRYLHLICLAHRSSTTHHRHTLSHFIHHSNSSHRVLFLVHPSQYLAHRMVHQ